MIPCSVRRTPARWWLAIVVFLLAAGPVAAQVTAGELYRRVSREKDKVDPKVLVDIARIGDLDSLRKLEKAVDVLRSGHRLNVACGAFTLYAKDAELRAAAVSFLEKTSLFGRNDEACLAATRTLVEFGKYGHPGLQRVLTKHKDARCRGIAADALLQVLTQDGDVGSLQLFLDHATLTGVGSFYVPGVTRPMRREEDSPHRAAVRAALVAMPGADAVGVLHARLRDPKTPGEWRLLFIEVLEDRGGDGLVPRLMELFTDRDPDVALAALDAVGRLGFPAEADMLLRQLLSSDSQALRASAVASLGLVAVLDPSWEKKLLGISKESDSALRMGAARALAHLHTVPALERLHEMLGDTDWAVRAEAVRQVGNLRRLPSVPLLIERLAVETGRMREDVAACLRLMTGLDHGRAAPRWERWWKAEGEGYELPTLEEAMRADEDRRRNDPGDEQRSVSSFYGLQVISDRVCFILDTSGSMSSAANWGGGRSQSDGKGPTRLDVAQQELGKALAAYPEGDYFNVVFFEGTAQPWEDQLQKMTEKVRAKVQKFVAKQNPAGGTALYDALQIAFDDPLVDTIYLLTDGAPSAGKVTDPALIRAEVSRWNRVRHVRIHCIAIGMDTELMRGLAADSGGEYRALR